jgi:hypothetical protein
MLESLSQECATRNDAALLLAGIGLVVLGTTLSTATAQSGKPLDQLGEFPSAVKLVDRVQHTHITLPSFYLSLPQANDPMELAFGAGYKIPTVKTLAWPATIPFWGPCILP